jgi:hypothetical protein
MRLAVRIAAWFLGALVLWAFIILIFGDHVSEAQRLQSYNRSEPAI